MASIAASARWESRASYRGQFARIGLATIFAAVAANTQERR